MLFLQSFIMLALGLSGIGNHLTQSLSVGADRLGAIVVENSVVLTKEEITRVVGMKRGQLIDDEGIEKAIARIKKAYLKLGLIEVRASIKKTKADRLSRENDGNVNLQITIEEGPRFLLRRTEVEGNHMTNHNVVMRAAGQLRPNQPYNPEDVEKWVRGLNRLGRFEPVKKADVEVTIDNHEHFVDVLFHLKERKGLKILRN